MAVVTFVPIATDRKRRDPPSKRSKFARVRNAERAYATKLKRVARTVGEIVRGYAGEDPVASAPELREALRRYAGVVAQWARRAAASMLAEVQRRDTDAWASLARTMSRELRREIETAPTGLVMRELLEEQVGLITSLPLEAAQRVQELATGNLYSGARAGELAEQIMRTGQVTAGRAALIARTETSKASSALLEARAKHVGSDGYIWRTSEDIDVRPLHRKLNGKFIRWDDPPVAGSQGELAHAGQIYNCFPGDTVVNLSNGCRRIFRMPYNGDLVVIVTVLGSFSATPNHPVLTSRGWRAAQDVEDGDDLVHAVHDVDLFDEHVDGPVTTFDQVFRALSICETPRESTVCDLYGDRADGEVDVIYADGLLPGDRVTEPFKRIADLAFTYPDRGVGARRVVRGGHKVLAPCLSSLDEKLFSPVTSDALHAQASGLASRANHDVVADQCVADAPAVYPKFSRDREFAGSSEVELNYEAVRQVCSSVMSGASAPAYFDPASLEMQAEVVRGDADSRGCLLDERPIRYEFLRVVNKMRRRFSDHVYTLESSTGSYTVTQNRIIVKNCRCWAEPVIPEEAA